MAAVGRRPCGFQGLGVPLPPAGLQGLPAALAAMCPNRPPQDSRVLFSCGGLGGAPEAEEIWKKGSVCGGAVCSLEQKGGGSQVNGPSLPVLVLPAPELRNQSVGTHRSKARPKGGRTSPPGVRGRGGRAGTGEPSSACPAGRLLSPHPQPLVT